MSWDRVTEVLDLESAFDARGEKAAEGRDQGGEGGEEENMELDRGDGDGCGEAVAVGPGGGDEGDGVGVWIEDGVGLAVEARPEVRAEVLCTRFRLWIEIGRIYGDSH